MAEPSTPKDTRTKAELVAEITRLREALREIKDIALCSEGVEFYAMLASRALGEEWYRRNPIRDL